MHRSSFVAVEDFVERHLASRRAEPLRILDLGSQDINGSFRPIFDRVRAWTYVGADVAPGKNVDLVLQTPYDWRELAAESFDVVVSGQALEHVEFFWLTAMQMSRVLRPGGSLCLIVPSRGAEHRYPVDCWRMYRDGMTALARWTRLTVLEAHTARFSKGHADMSEEWADSVLIAQKPIYSRRMSLARRLKLAAACRALAAMAPKPAVTPAPTGAPSGVASVG